MDALKTGGLIVQARKEKELTQKDLLPYSFGSENLSAE